MYTAKHSISDSQNPTKGRFSDNIILVVKSLDFSAYLSLTQIIIFDHISTKYLSSKRLQDLIHKLQDNVHEHEAYNENFSECAEWVNTLARRLQVCADMAGDKHDVEDRLAKLQVIDKYLTCKEDFISM